MKKLALSFALLALFALGGQSFALIGTIDNVPAATLLVPYFEIDPANATGLTTLFSVNNASATAVLVHATVWSDQSVPVLDFDIYLTGYDVQTVNLRDVLVAGLLPQTASAGQDGGDKISPKGPVSQDINFASCSGVLPPGPLGAGFRAHLLAWLTGNKSPTTGDCAGAKTGDGIMRGYVTLDTVNSCNKFFPSDGIAYNTVLTYQNVLWGDVIYVNPSQNFATAQPAVHIEADPVTMVAPLHTFYGRYLQLAPATDHREALPTTMASRFVNGGGFSGGTSLIVWREANQSATSYSCNLQGPPSWYPLGSTQIALFDEQEHPVTTQPCQSGDPTCSSTITIPNETQRVSVADDLLSPFQFGWVYLNLQHSGLSPAYADNFAQMWLISNMTASGQYEVDIDGVQLDNANRPIVSIIPVP